MDNEKINYIKNQILERIDPMRDTGEEAILEIIDEVLTETKDIYSISILDRKYLQKTLLNNLKKLDILQELLDMDNVSEVMVNGWEKIFYESDGHIYKWEKSFESPEKLKDIVQRIAAGSNKIINESNPLSDVRLESGYRASVVMDPVAINGPIVTIRKFYSEPFSIEKMIKMNSISREAADFLKTLVEARYNIFISGGTGSGKTTFLNALSNFIPKDERIITIEDSAELKLMGIENLVRLEARKANIEGKNEITIRDLIKASLRMRPDRVIVGEVRGGESLDMLQAMNTGHDGSMSTGHGNGPEDMLIRLETMVLMSGLEIPIMAVRGQISSAIDIIVHLGRLRDKSRRVLSISEVCNMDNTGKIVINDLFRFEEEGENEDGTIKGTIKATENKLINTRKLKAKGIFDKFM